APYCVLKCIEYKPSRIYLTRPTFERTLPALTSRHYRGWRLSPHLSFVTSNVMSYLFTSESVSEGHPDTVADQISDVILDALLEQDPRSRVAVETLVTTGLVVLSGEVTTKAYVDVQSIAREVIRDIGYTDPSLRFDADSCGVLSSIHEQSPDIKQGVDQEIGRAHV